MTKAIPAPQFEIIRDRILGMRRQTGSSSFTNADFRDQRDENLTAVIISTPHPVSGLDESTRSLI